jgi:Uma2 family endonuclease
VSEGEFLALPESNQPIELIDGEVILAPRPSLRHQEVLTRVVAALREWANAHRARATIVQAPFDVRFGPNRILQPDAVVFLYGLADDVETPVTQVPDLCVEVLSGNRAHDRVTKRYVYGEAGVPEYWIIDPAGVIERRTGPALTELELVQEHLSTPLLPGFALDLARLLPRH